MLQDVKWIFFDLGSTLIDETDADLFRIREMIKGSGVTEEMFCEKRLEMIQKGLNGDLAIDHYKLVKTPWHSELERPYKDTAKVLKALKEKGYRLGVIANQTPGTEQRLLSWDLLQFFDLVASSAELGLSKPDPDIFSWALKKAGCSSKDAAMIGDRLDNDIAPANRLGMHTVRILQGLGAYHEPSDEDEHPMYTVRSLSEIPGLFLFLRYHGSHFHMDRDGAGDEYAGYGISRETEKIWAKEFVSDLFRSKTYGKEALDAYLTAADLLGAGKTDDDWMSCLYYPLRAEHLDDVTRLFMLGTGYRMAENAVKKHLLPKEEVDAYKKAFEVFAAKLRERAEKEVLTRSDDYVMREFADPVYTAEYLDDLKRKWTDLAG